MNEWMGDLCVSVKTLFPALVKSEVEMLTHSGVKLPAVLVRVVVVCFPVCLCVSVR